MNFVKPVLAFLFNRKQLDTLISLTRNEIRNNLGALGLLVEISINEPAYVFDENGLLLGIDVWGDVNNLIYPSEDFNSWTKNDITVSVDAETGPDGEPADEIIEDAGAITPSAQNANTAVTSGNWYCYWADVALGDTTAIRDLRLTLGSPGGGGNVFFDIENGVILSGETDAGMIPLGNGFYRCYKAKQASSTANTGVFWGLSNNTNSSYTGNGSSSLIFAKSGVNPGKYPAPYKKTTAAAAANEPDDYLLTDLSKLDVAGGKGSILVHAKNLISGLSPVFFRMKNDAGTSYIEINRDTDDVVHCLVVTGGVTQADIEIEDASSEIIALVSYKNNQVTLSVNGSDISEDLTATIATDFTSVIPGGNGTDYLNAALTELAFFGVSLDSDLMKVYSRAGR